MAQHSASLLSSPAALAEPANKCSQDWRRSGIERPQNEIASARHPDFRKWQLQAAGSNILRQNRERADGQAESVECRLQHYKTMSLPVLPCRRRPGIAGCSKPILPIAGSRLARQNGMRRQVRQLPKRLPREQHRTRDDRICLIEKANRLILIPGLR